MKRRVLPPGMPLTVKGQVTVPKPVRDHLGLGPGSRVAFVTEPDGRVTVSKADSEAGRVVSRFARARASAGRNGLSTQEIMGLTRGEGWVTLIDTNVLLDLTGQDGGWADWSQRMLEAAALRGPLAINDVVFAELSIGYDRIEDCQGLLDAVGIGNLAIPRGALFLAGKVFRAYRRRGGPRSGVLPDFFIGAHALHEGLPLITRDPRRYRSNYLALRLLAPDNHP